MVMTGILFFIVYIIIGCIVVKVTSKIEGLEEPDDSEILLGVFWPIVLVITIPIFMTFMLYKYISKFIDKLEIFK